MLCPCHQEAHCPEFGFVVKKSVRKKSGAFLQEGSEVRTHRRNWSSGNVDERLLCPCHQQTHCPEFGFVVMKPNKKSGEGKHEKEEEDSVVMFANEMVLGQKAKQILFGSSGEVLDISYDQQRGCECHAELICPKTKKNSIFRKKLKKTESNTKPTAASMFQNKGDESPVSSSTPSPTSPKSLSLSSSAAGSPRVIRSLR